LRLSDLGQFLLIERLSRIVASARPDVVAGIGDDAAALDLGGEELVLAKVDSQVEGVHFRRDRIPPHSLGRRSLAIVLSDIAAMGGRPTHALVSLALPADLEVTWVEDLYRGLREEGDRFGVAIVGGHTARSPVGVVIDVCLLGQVSRARILTRAGARPGDAVLVTGSLGDAAAGLALLDNPRLHLPAAVRDGLIARHLTPTPRLPESAVIAASALATAMIDLSDGLASDISHVCNRSGVGVKLYADRLPISMAVGQVSERIGRAPWDLALGGGEDYELCFTAPAAAAPALAERVTAETSTPVTVVGEILPAPAGRWLVLLDGREVPLEAQGWRHF
jgi:thiamine-monophosphate kinase